MKDKIEALKEVKIKEKEEKDVIQQQVIISGLLFCWLKVCSLFWALWRVFLLFLLVL